MIKKRYKARKSSDYNLNNLLSKYESFKNSSKNQFYYLTRSFNGFDELTVERRDELKEEAKEFQERYCEKNDVLCPNYYIILNKLDKDMLNNNYTSYEAIALLIETIDPTLKLLKISRRCKAERQLEVLSNQIFGFYDYNLINYEIEYAKMFYKTNIDILKKKLGI